MLLCPTVLLRQKTVLVVDDQEAVRRYTGRVMENAGYNVLTARDGIHALSLLQQSRLPVQLVITDVCMPGMTGPELAACIAAEPYPPPVLFVSGGHGYTDLPGPVLWKPFLPHALRRLAGWMLSGSSGQAPRPAPSEWEEPLMPSSSLTDVRVDDVRRVATSVVNGSVSGDSTTTTAAVRRF